MPPFTRTAPSVKHIVLLEAASSHCSRRKRGSSARNNDSGEDAHLRKIKLVLRHPMVDISKCMTCVSRVTNLLLILNIRVILKFFVEGLWLVDFELLDSDDLVLERKVNVWLCLANALCFPENPKSVNKQWRACMKIFSI